jgi:thiamine biosynthesis protein ThiI
MIFLVRVSPEIIVKSREVRRRHIRILRRSLRTQLALIDPEVSVTGEWVELEIVTAVEDGEPLQRLEQLLANTPGIAMTLQVNKHPLLDMDSIAARVLKHYAPLLEGKSFVVRCKRVGEHAFSSGEVERYVGAVLLRESGAAGVDLHNPDILVKVEIHHNVMSVVERTIKGLGGYPLGTQDGVLSLISGGFDSSVASYMCIRRGLLTHYCFFNLGGAEHELAVKEVALYLWMKFGASHRVKFVSVPFQAVVDEIVSKVSNAQMGVILKRMMLRAADRVADILKLEALVTGESVAQVASQTLANLALIEKVTSKLVLRPLITSDKQSIIDIARGIGTEEFSRHVPEYCGVISVRPTTRARSDKIAVEEERFDFSVLDAAVSDLRIQMIDRVMEGREQDAIQVDEFTAPDSGTVIIDIRHPEEEERRPLAVGVDAEIEKIPFYALRVDYPALPQDRQYLLYCDKGMMSRLQAQHLRDSGYYNVAVYRPAIE